LTGVAVAVITLVCAGLLAAAALAPAPPPVLPLLIVACLACPMLAVFELGTTLSDLRRREHRAIEELRSQLRRLPETQHPLGL
jgi:hypothetical protein